MNKWKHNINETSSLFQGHVDQLFSLNKIGFKVNSVYEDSNKLLEINNERFRRFFILNINKLLEKRGTEGYEYNKITDQGKGLKIVYPKITNDRSDEESGTFELYPKTAICPNCHRYMRLDHPEDKCGCDVKLEQFTFIAFCDECGAHYPIHPMSNVLNDCSKCKQKNALRKINWGQRDDLSSYIVSCTNCGHTEGLVLYKCDHIDHQTKKRRSNKPQSKFRGVPARAGAVIHPMILTLPNIPTIVENGANSNISDVALSQLFSEAFNYFFRSLDLKVQESLLYSPDFWEILNSDVSFWSKRPVIESIHLMDLDKQQVVTWSHELRIRFIQGLLIEARNKISMSNKQVEIQDTYGIEAIRSCLDRVKDKALDEREQQGIYILRSDQFSNENDTYAKLVPESRYPDNGAFLEKLGIERIGYITNLRMLQTLIGVVEGSMRRDPLLFRTIDDHNGTPTVYVRKMFTEGIYFKLSSKRILHWLYSNQLISETLLSTGDQNDGKLRELVVSNNQIKMKVHLLLHTFSHTLIQNASINTGLDAQSISEMLFPTFGMILLYSTSPINVGGLEYTFDNLLYKWLQEVRELAEECPQDPACMIDEGGACNACLFVPEFVCENFNDNLDRDSLIGEIRYKEGYFDAR